MVTIRKNLVSENIALRITSGIGNIRRKVVIHETDNARATANADAHSRLQANGNSRQASWHYQVDDKEAVQSFDHTYKCWAAGNSKGNNEGIHVEICVNSDGDYKKAVQNTAELVAKILKEEKLTINDVVQHNYYSGKNCPRIMRSGSVIPWSSFIQMVKSNLESKKEVKEVEKKEQTVSDWAKTSWEKAQKKKGIDGKTPIIDGTNPKGELTREQFAVVLDRLGFLD